jgi:hypothetical protein
MQQENGLIAILDALGAANYSDAEIDNFLDSRSRVLGLLKQKAGDDAARWDIDPQKTKLSTFTFNDTVLILYRKKIAKVSTDDVGYFSSLLRKFLMDSIVNGILFRGSMSIGQFYVNDETNTVMGRAVTDAAAWYDSADWIGINATPHATLAIQGLPVKEVDELEAVLIDYAVPLKDGSSTSLKAVNWPKAFAVKNLTPCVGGEDRRAKCLSLLTQHRVPKGTESKYFNSMKFFDHCIKAWKEKREKEKEKTKEQSA